MNNSINAVFTDDTLAKEVFDTYREHFPDRSYTLESCQRALKELFKHCTLEARKAHELGELGLFNIESEVLRYAILQVAEEGLSLLPASKHFYFAVELPDYARVPQLYARLRKRGIYHLICNSPNYELFTLDLVHQGDTFKWKGQNEKPVYESSPENMKKPLVGAWCRYKEKGMPEQYYFIDGGPIEAKGEEQTALDPSTENPWVRFPRITKEAEALRMAFNALNPIYLFTNDSSMESDMQIAISNDSESQLRAG
jgi:hypothetical protein